MDLAYAVVADVARRLRLVLGVGVLLILLAGLLGYWLGRSTVLEIPDSPPVEAGDSEGTYTVRSGDTLISIAREVYSNGSRWKDLYEANKDKLKSPDHLQVGQVLVLP